MNVDRCLVVGIFPASFAPPYAETTGNVDPAIQILALALVMIRVPFVRMASGLLGYDRCWKAVLIITINLHPSHK